MHKRHAALLLMSVVIAGAGSARSAAPSAMPNENKHLGAGSCGSSVCHGKIAPAPNHDVQLNEYTTWLHSDRHSQAFNRLKSPDALKIGAKLGIPSPSTSKLCLPCHADTQAPSAVGETAFRVSDGVGCEACHGGAEKWIKAHAQSNATHRDNVARGMYATEQPLERATICLSCHLGTRDRFATHVIMGAGHPRLAFELNTYTENQPRHYETTPKYIARKGKIDGMNLWVTGQIESAERFLTLLDTDVLTPGGMIPELALYECFSCHHRMDDQRWTRARAGPGIAPGTLRLQKPNLVMLQVLASVIEPSAEAELESATNEMIRSGQTDPQTLRASARRLLNIVKSHESWSTRGYSTAEVSQVRKALLRAGMDDKASDFTVAEQLFMGVDSLSYALRDQDARKGALDAVFDKLKSGPGFNSAQFADTIRRVQGQF